MLEPPIPIVSKTMWNQTHSEAHASARITEHFFWNMSGFEAEPPCERGCVAGNPTNPSFWEQLAWINYIPYGIHLGLYQYYNAKRVCICTPTPHIFFNILPPKKNKKTKLNSPPIFQEKKMTQQKHTQKTKHNTNDNPLKSPFFLLKSLRQVDLSWMLRFNKPKASTAIVAYRRGCNNRSSVRSCRRVRKLDSKQRLALRWLVLGLPGLTKGENEG